MTFSEGKDRMSRAYEAAAKIAKLRIVEDSPDDARALEGVRDSDIVVVPGEYDQVELVLDALQMPYLKLSPEQVAKTPLRPEQLLIVNCPGKLPRESITSVRDFVTKGGSLFTTDWALRNVIELAFPGYIEYNENPTTDDVVRIEVLKKDNPFLKGVMDKGDDPQWWLEGSSYPMKVLAEEKVEVLITSKELGTKYGEAPVAVLFRHGEGEVFHMISHYYLQRTELRSARQKMPAAMYASQKGYTMSASDASVFADLSVGDVESATSSARLLANIVAGKKKRGS